MCSHAPDLPFGCCKTWGPPLLRPDSRRHICNRSSDHAGRHQCKCGAWMVAGSATPTGVDDE